VKAARSSMTTSSRDESTDSAGARAEGRRRPRRPARLLDATDRACRSTGRFPAHAGDNRRACARCRAVRGDAHPWKGTSGVTEGTYVPIDRWWSCLPPQVQDCPAGALLPPRVRPAEGPAVHSRTFRVALPGNETSAAATNPVAGAGRGPRHVLTSGLPPCLWSGRLPSKLCFRCRRRNRVKTEEL
jgi:hypothetical protein